jgi:competence protein ComEA
MTRSSKSIWKTAFALGLAVLLGVGGTTSLFGQTSAKTNSASAKMITPVDVNSADLKTLETLPGVGAATAQKIVDGRPYKTLADLQKVKGLGKSKIAAMKDFVIFGPSAADPGATVTMPKTATASTPAASSSSAAPATTATSASKPSGGSGSGTSGGRLAPGQKVNINTATAAELDKIPGIGPAKAQAIVDYRTQNGNFAAIEDIQKVKGIKSGVFGKIRDYIKTSD